MQKRLFIICTALLLALSGCVSSLTGDTYSRDEARRPMSFREGTLVGIRTVRLEGTQSNIGTVLGAGMGGVAASGIGAGRGSIVAAIAGAIVGGLVGSAAEEGLTRENAYELTVRLDDGKSMIIVQGMGNDKFSVGDRVRVVQGAGNTRVTKADSVN